MPGVKHRTDYSLIDIAYDETRPVRFLELENRAAGTEHGIGPAVRHLLARDNRQGYEYRRQFGFGDLLIVTRDTRRPYALEFRRLFVDHFVLSPDTCAALH